MEVFALGMKIKEEGAATVKSSVDRMRASLRDVQKDAKVADKGLRDLNLAATLAGTAIGALIVAGFSKLIRSSAEAQFVQAQLEAAIRSTGNAAGLSVNELNAHAEALMRVSMFGDEAIGSAQALLLTFTQVRGPIFKEATERILDVAQAMAGQTGGTPDLKNATIQVGKALNDPIRGVTALARAGIQFTEAQKGMIARLVETNRLAEAQKIVLSELETQFGGSARAARNTLGGALAALREEWGNLFEVSRESSQGMIDAIEGITKRLPAIRNGLASFLTDSMVLIREFSLYIERANQRAYEQDARSAREWEALFEKIAAVPGTKLADKVRDWFHKRAGESDQMVAAYKDNADEMQKALDNFLLSTIGLGERAAGAVGGVKKKVDELNTSLRALPAPGAGTTRLGWDESMRDKVEGKGAGLPEKMRILPGLSLDQARSKMEAEAALLTESIRTTFKEGIAEAITGGLIAGVTAAVASGSIGEGFASLTGALLSGLGTSMIEFGVASLKLAALMDGLLSSFANLLPGGATAKAIAMIALGAALKGVAARAFGGRSGGSGGLGGGFGSSLGSGASTGLDGATRLVFGPTSAGVAAGMRPREANTFVIIGPDDPTAQRTIEELLEKARRRGGIG